MERPVFDAPPSAAMTVADVLAAPEREPAMMRWAQIVWESWSAEHESVRKLVAQGLS